MRQAARQRKFLPANFWNSPLWRAEYASQIAAAHNLLKYFSFKQIIDTLDDNKNKWISTLRYKNLINLISERKAVTEIKVEQEKRVIAPVNKEDALKAPVVPKKQNTLSKLRDLDE